MVNVLEELKLRPDTLPLLRSCRGLSQAEMAIYMGIPQARLSDIETGRVELSKHYENKLWLAIQRLQISSNELQSIAELVQNAKKLKGGIDYGKL